MNKYVKIVNKIEVDYEEFLTDIEDKVNDKLLSLACVGLCYNIEYETDDIIALSIDYLGSGLLDKKFNGNIGYDISVKDFPNEENNESVDWMAGRILEEVKEVLFDQTLKVEKEIEKYVKYLS